jgi:hypothetical protein
MKKTTILKVLTTIVVIAFTSLFITSCIPTTPTGGNPTPTPQTDTSVIYKLENKIIIDYNQTTNNDQGLPIDLDSNGTIDFNFNSYNGNYGYANTNIWSTTNSELAIKSDTGLDINRFRFLSNDIIDVNNYFSSDRIIFLTNYNTSGSQTVYVGFRLTKDDGYHYGWMQLKMDVVFNGIAPWIVAKNIKLTLINYAYKKAPNTPILAGKY